MKLLVRKWYTFWRLEWRSRWLFFQALWLLPVVALSLRIWGFRRTQSTLARLVTAPVMPSPSTNQLPQVKNTARMVGLAVRYSPPWANCLKKSLVLWWLLRRQGIDSELRIGVQCAGNFQAHAWVEYEKVVLNDRWDVRDRFAVFERSI